jgi:CheY-like chemotaxis protein
MPKSDGITAAREIKARAPETKIVLMSGYGSEKAVERASDKECIDAAISKPFRLAEIRETLNALLGSR